MVYLGDEERNNEDNQSYKNFGMSSSNQGFNSAGALQIRLDTSFLAEFEKYLLGVDTQIVQDDQGQFTEQVVWQGEAVVNTLGYQTVMQWMKIVINKTTLQGNFITEDDYGNFMCDVHRDVLEDLMTRRKDYGLNIRDLQPLLHKFMNCTRVVMTRQLFNKERDGMNNTMRVHETMQSQNNSKGFFSMPFFGGKK